MTHNFELTVSASLSGKLTEDIVRSVVEEQTGKKVASLTPKIRSEQRGMSVGASSTQVFDGYDIKFIPERVAKSNQTTKPQFKEDKYE
jgi:hypothetical protein